MKNLKFTFLFFVVFSCFLIASCTSKEEVKSSNTTALDSISLFMKDMKNNDLDFNTRLNRANRALQKIENKRSDTRIEQILAYKIYLFGNLKQLDSAVSINKALIQINIEKNDSVAIANNYYQLAYYYFQNDKKDSAFIANKLSKEIYIKLGDSSKIGENLAQMAIIQSGLGDFIGSDNNAIQALKYLDKDNLVYISAIYNSIAISAKKRKDYKEAIYWYNKAIETSTINSFKAVKSGNLAVVYRYLQEYDKSIAIFEELIKGGSLDNDIKAKSRVLDNLAYTKWLANENENVSDDLLAVLNTRREENDLWGLNASYAHLADYYKNKNPDIALKYARKMYKQAKLLNSAEDQLEAMQKLIELETSVKAKEYYHTYIKLSDSLMDAERNKLNKFEKLKYDSEKNREDNLQLKITNSKKELQLEKEKTRNIIGAASSGTVVLGLLGFLYYRKQKHRQEKRAEVYKTETRIAKKLHDEVANNMVNIMNKVQYTEDPKEQLLDDLEKVYLLTRDISH
ncbi:tetratricopeptide repeat protein, partial [Lutibacter litoralis]